MLASGWHSNGECLHNRSRTALCANGECEEGDRLRVRVAAGGELSFFRNGDLVSTEGAKGNPKLPPGKYVLCCQPYMGGAAQLLASKGVPSSVRNVT